MATSNTGIQTVSTELPAVPLTVEGSSVLHQMFRFRWAEWRKLSDARRAEVAGDAAHVLAPVEEAGQRDRKSVV